MTVSFHRSDELETVCNRESNSACCSQCSISFIDVPAGKCSRLRSMNGSGSRGTDVFRTCYQWAND
uniref:Uncharacterized protein n=1 Tax=Pristionchus pacificus TaxID=54126 RepID=A0A2A6BU24_PRIPA|eukprot:PDM69251.1 hypothetical protein PRIPAC_47553 [Pristionchus pacificus]